MARGRKKSMKAWEKELYRLAEAEEWRLLGQRAEICIEQYPDDAFGYYMAIVAAIQLNNEEKAFQIFQQPAESGIANVTIMENIATRMLERDDEDTLLMLEKAFTVFITKAEDINPKHHLLRGIARTKLGKNEEAIKDFTICFEKDATKLDALWHRQQAYHHLGQDEKSLKDLNLLIKAKPEEEDYYSDRGKCYIKLQRFEEAIADFDIAIKYNPSISDYYNSRGVAKFQLERFDDARADFEQAISLDEDNAKALSNLGGLKSDFGEHEDGLKDLNKSIEIDNKDSMSSSNRGNVKVKLGLYDDASDDFEKALEIAPDNADLQAKFGYVLGLKKSQEISGKVIANYEANLGEVTNANTIIKLYQNEIDFLHQRLYGIGSDDSDVDGYGSGSGSGNGNANGNNDTPQNKRPQNSEINETIVKNAVEASKNLAEYVFGIAVFVSLLFLFIFHDLFQTGLRTLEVRHLFLYTSTIGFCSAPLLLHRRYMIKRAEQERTLLHALMRDRNMLLFWNAQEPEDKTTKRSKLATTIADHLSTNSAADVSLKMMNPKHHQTNKMNKQDKTLSRIDTKLTPPHKKTLPR